MRLKGRFSTTFAKFKDEVWLLQFKTLRTEKGKEGKSDVLWSNHILESRKKLQPRKGHWNFRSVPRTWVTIPRHVDDVDDVGGAHENRAMQSSGLHVHAETRAEDADGNSSGT